MPGIWVEAQVGTAACAEETTKNSAAGINLKI